jgi:DNA gyrase subunit B
VLVVNPEAPPLSGPALESLANDYMAVMATIRRLGRRYDTDLLERLIYMPPMTATVLQDKDALSNWYGELEARMNAGLISGQRYQVEIKSTGDNGDVVAAVSKWTHGIVASEQNFTPEFFSSAEYAHMVALGQQLDGLLSEGAYVQRGERREDISSFKQALNWLLDEAKRGQHIQRYKGLGEMNPDQLWETTLDPETRRLLRVR